ncbi:MAG: hypothetical protein WBB69_06710 [Anaerolineales bacterium]
MVKNHPFDVEIQVERTIKPTRRAKSSRGGLGASWVELYYLSGEDWVLMVLAFSLLSTFPLKKFLVCPSGDRGIRHFK